MFLFSLSTVTGVNVSNPINETTSGIGGPCPEGHYCPQQTEDPLACPLGTYRNAEFGADPNDCFLCEFALCCSFH